MNYRDSSINILTYGRGIPLVFFHGWGFNAQIWLSLVPLLSAQYQLYLVDLPGFGLTPDMPWESFKSALLKQLPQTFLLIGWSMGGLLATRLAIEEPNRIQNLINVNSSPCFIQYNNWPGVDPSVFKRFYQELANNPGPTLQTFMALQLQGKHVALGPTPSQVGLRLGLDVLMNEDFRQDISLLKKPVAYMFGRLDKIVPLATMEVMQSRYPHFKYILFSKASHAPFISHQNEFIEALESIIW